MNKREFPIEGTEAKVVVSTSDSGDRHITVPTFHLGYEHASEIARMYAKALTAAADYYDGLCE
jgi:hypothetical protein